MTCAAVPIREFNYPQDYESAVRLWQSLDKGVHFGRSDVPSEIEKKLARDPDLFLVAESDGELVGTVIGGFDGRRGMIYHLAVAHAHRRRGVAEALLREIENRLVARGCIRAFLLVHAENEEARALYEKQDWVLLTDNVVYSKDIA